MLDCICPAEENGIDRLVKLGVPTCGTCYIGVPSATFSPNLQDVRLEFGGVLVISDLFLDNTNQLCEIMVAPDVLRKFGKNPVCYVTSEYFAIKLGALSTIRENEQIALRNSTRPILNFDGCSEINGNPKYLNTMLRTDLALPIERLTPRVFFEPLPNPVSLCDDVVLNVVDSDVTGNRIPANFRWTLVSITPDSANLRAAIEKLIVSSADSTQLVVPAS
jgi:hypothetical protein